MHPIKKILEGLLRENENVSHFKNFSDIVQRILECDTESSEKELSDIDKAIENIRVQANTKMELNLIDGLEKDREERKKLLLINELWGDFYEEDQDASTSIFIDIIIKKKFHEVLRLKNLKEKETVLKELSTIIPRMVQKKAKSTKELRKPLSPEFLKETEKLLQEKFPGLGNQQYRRAQSMKFQAATRESLIRQFGDFILKRINEAYKEFNNIEMLIYNACDRIDETFDQRFTESYKKRVVICASHEIEQKYQRTLAQKSPAKQKEEATESASKIFTQRMNQAESPEFVLPEYLQKLFPGEYSRKYVTRLARNGKEIRMMDLEERFGIDPKIFTPEIIKQAEKDKIFIVKDVQKLPLEKTEEEKKPGEKTVIAEPRMPTPEEERLQDIQAYIRANLGNFSAEHCIHALEMEGYQIANKKSFKKGFDKLYATPEKILEFAEELAEKIQEPSPGMNAKNNRQYRTIDLEDDKRILFFEKNIIDGIYSHNEYMKRLSNQK